MLWTQLSISCLPAIANRLGLPHKRFDCNMLINIVHIVKPICNWVLIKMWYIVYVDAKNFSNVWWDSNGVDTLIGGQNVKCVKSFSHRNSYHTKCHRSYGSFVRMNVGYLFHIVNICLKLYVVKMRFWNSFELYQIV